MAGDALEVQKACEELVSLLAVHASVHDSNSPDAAEAAQVFESLRQALARYEKAVANRSGWNVPYLVAPDDPAEGAWGTKDDEAQVRLIAEYTVELIDLERAKVIALSRLEGSGRAATISADELDDPVDLVRVLFEIDGWHPERYGDDILAMSQPWTLDVGLV